MLHPFRPEQLSSDVRPSESDIQSVLITPERMQERIAELGVQLSRDYEGKDPVLVGVLVGAAVFTADLLRCVTEPCFLDFVAISSYGKESRSSGVVRILKDLDRDITDRNVVIVEDIVDSGLTLSWLLSNLKSRRPASVEVFALLRKPEAMRMSVNVKYIGFDIPNEFVVGYGLDYDERYRNLRDVATLARHVYA